MEINNLIRSLLNHEKTDQSHIQLIRQFLSQSVLIPELKIHLNISDTKLENSSLALEYPIHIDPFNQISAYLICVQQYCEYEKIYAWGVCNLHAACILKSIKSLAKKDHQNTIIKVFNRFRLASDALVYAKANQPLTHYQEQYLWLWEQLPQENINLADLVEYLCNLEKKPNLTSFQRLLITDIRRFYGYVLALKPKKGYTPTIHDKNQKEYLDENEAILICSANIPRKQNTALFYEQTVDDNLSCEYQVDTAKVSPLVHQSEFMQNKVAHLSYQHILRQNHHFASSQHYPDLESLQLLIQYCHQSYNANPYKNKSYLIILLSFLTGVPLDQWLKIQFKNRYALNQRQKLIQVDEEYFLRSKFSLFENKDFEFKSGLLNDVTYFDLPLIKSLIVGLKQPPLLEHQHVTQALKQCREELFIPSLSTKKLSVLLHYCIYQHTQNEQLADILTGIDANRSVSLSYASYPIYRLHASYISSVKQLSETLAEQIHCTNDQNLRFGSLKAPKPEKTTAIFAYLFKQVIQAQHQHQFIEAFNYYNVWLWHILLLFSGARPVADFPGFLKNFDLDQAWFWVSDKEIHSRKDDGRLLPLCDFLIDEIKAFLQYLNHFQHLYPEHSPHIKAIFSNDKPLLSVYVNDDWQALNPTLISRFTYLLKLEHTNWLRHSTRAYLTDKIDEKLILTLLGHESPQQEMGACFSSLSLKQYKTLSSQLNDCISPQLKRTLNIKS